jgi:ketosteroid isomerase-like protein
LLYIWEMSREVGERRGVTVRGRPFVVFGFRVTDGKIVEIDAIADPDRVRRAAASVLTEG